MAKKPSDENGQSNGRPWLTARECWTLLGITRQRWQRLVLECQIPKREDDAHIERFDPDAVDDVAERFGFSNADDPRVEALKVLRAALDTMGKHCERLADENLDLIKELRLENAAMRERSSKEQEAHLKALIATQEALDLSADRKMNLVVLESREKIKADGLQLLGTRIWPAIEAQMKAGKPIVKPEPGIDFSHLSDMQLAAMKARMSKEQENRRAKKSDA